MTNGNNIGMPDIFYCVIGVNANDNSCHVLTGAYIFAIIMQNLVQIVNKGS